MSNSVAISMWSGKTASGQPKASARWDGPPITIMPGSWITMTTAKPSDNDRAPDRVLFIQGPDVGQAPKDTPAPTNTDDIPF